MKDDFYLRPFNHSIKSNGFIKYSNADILKLRNNNTFVIKESIEIKSVINKLVPQASFINYKNLKNRLQKINNPFIPKILKKHKKPLIMGILNITKDSFYDGGRYLEYKNAIKHAEKLIKEGADIIDIGGESTRPGSMAVNVKEEIKRIKPIIKELKKNNFLVSCDTRNSTTMSMALDLGVDIINDVSGLNYDKNTLNILKNYKCLYVLMHSKETPTTMQNNPIYNNVACDIYNFFTKKLMLLKKMNISENRVILDPGIGFGKTISHNYNILRYLNILLDLGHPLMIGVSRKSLIKKLVKSNSLTPSILLAINAYSKGVSILRVHDVEETKLAVNIFKKAN